MRRDGPVVLIAADHEFGVSLNVEDGQEIFVWAETGVAASLSITAGCSLWQR